MAEKEIIIDKDRLWSYNEALYTEDFCKKLREERQRDIQEKMKKSNKEVGSVNQEQIIGSSLRKYERDMRSQGEIIDVFIRQHLEAKITTARWMLALAMGVTLLFKGAWVLWILFIILYNWEVKRFKKEALKEDLKRGNGNEWMD